MIKALAINGAYLFDLKGSQDERGVFFKVLPIISLGGLPFSVSEVFYSSSKKDVIRGMHFQRPPNAQSKIVTVVKGRITDVILDLRKGSKSYGKFMSIDLKENEGKSLFIPKGIAHGFVGRETENIVLYITDAEYSKQDEDGIRYDSFGYEWNVSKPVLSDRDLALQRFNEFKSPFKM